MSKDWEPPKDLLDKSRAHLSDLFQKQWKIDNSTRQTYLPLKDAKYQFIRKIGEDSGNAEEVVNQLMKQSDRDRDGDLDDPPENPRKPRNSPQDGRATTAITLAHPFRWDWSSFTHTQSGSSTVAASKTSGSLEFSVYSGGNGGTGSGAVAVGDYFRPTASTQMLHVYATPSINYRYHSFNSFDDSQTHGFIGIYVGEYTLAGEFVGAVVNQQINLWTLDDGGAFSGAASGFPLSAATPVDNNHFYEIWVWAGGSAAGDGWGSIWGGVSYGNLKVNVPSISIFAY